MNKLVIPVILLLVSVGAMVGAVFALRKDEFPDVKNEADCIDPLKKKLPKSCQTDPNCCTIWQNGMCRKGKIKGLKCQSEGDLLPFILLLLAVGFFIAFIVYLVKALRQK